MLRNGCLHSCMSTTLSSKDIFFKITAISSAQTTMSLPITENPMSMSCLWHKLSSNAFISMKLLVFMKVVEIAHVQMLGSVEDEEHSTPCHFWRAS